MRKYFISLSFLSILLLSSLILQTHTAFADVPVVSSFNAPTSLESGQPANLGWTISGGGHSLILYCAQGVKFLYVSTGATFPCDTRVSVSSGASDGVSVTVANISGSARIVTVKIIPKDGNGVDYDMGAREASIYVNPAREPIRIFYSEATTTVSGVPTTLRWTSNYLDGVNLRIACNSAVTATSSVAGVTQLPCGQVIFPNDLPGSGSITLQFKNESSLDQAFDVTLLPAMSPGVYDGTHPMTLTLTVASDAQKPVSVDSFTSSRKTIFSGDSVSFGWSIANASGANLKFSCAPLTEYQLITSSSTIPLPCNDYAWTNALLPTGTTSIAFFNFSSRDQTSYISIFPQLKDGTYDGAKVKSLQILTQPYIKVATSTIAAQTQTIVTTTGTSQTQTSQTTTTSPATVPASTGTLKNVFKRPLEWGSSGADVKALQTFLAKDKEIYPEGLITSFFGPATERALGRFQLKYGLVKSTQEPAYGFVGPKTRALLNSL